MEPISPPFIAKKKLCNLARLSFFMIRKGVSKSKLVLDDLQFLVKRGKTMGKALNDASLMSCRPRDVHLSFVSPMEYEFSCRTSPSYQPFHGCSKRKARYPYTRSRTRDGYMILGALGCRDAGDFESPLVVPKGRRKSVQIRQVDVDDSPAFVLNDIDDYVGYVDDDDYCVDEAAEEFIQRFHMQLRLQKWLAVLDAADIQYYG